MKKQKKINVIVVRKIIEKGIDNMLSAEQMVLEENKMLINEGKRIGMSIMCINMLKMGYSIETISKISGKSIKELESLKNNIK